MRYEQRHDLLPGRTVWQVRVPNTFDETRTLLLSKVSEALRPRTPDNHVGEGGTLDDFLRAQPGVRFVINGGFNHYRKAFYAWPNQAFNVGDPVGLVKIREHFFEDVLDPSLFGYLVQGRKGEPWRIVQGAELDRHSKYILGCTPLLLLRGQPRPIPREALAPVAPGCVNPPSVLGHGLQRHPRTAVGIQGDELVFVLVEGAQGGGCTLLELQQLGVELGLSEFLNLDGGGSSQFRLRTDAGWVCNRVAPEDSNRVLGHVIVLFEEALKVHA